jgi:hypothetical protein
MADAAWSCKQSWWNANTIHWNRSNRKVASRDTDHAKSLQTPSFD